MIHNATVECGHGKRFQKNILIIYIVVKYPQKIMIPRNERVGSANINSSDYIGRTELAQMDG